MTCLYSPRASVDSLKAIDSVLDQQATNTGLAINKSKSKIFFSRGCNNKDALKEAIGIVEGRMPTKYLGIPLSVNYLKAKNYSALIDKCRGGIEAGWLQLYLSLGE